MSNYKEYQDGTAFLKLTRDMFADKRTFDDIAQFLCLSKERDIIYIQIDSNINILGG